MLLPSIMEWSFNTGGWGVAGKFVEVEFFLGPRRGLILFSEGLNFFSLFMPDWQTFLNKCYKKADFMKNNCIYKI